MILLPQKTKEIIVTNGKSAFQGTIAYTKNIDLDEEGYIKLSPPMVRIYSSEDDGDFDLPVDMFAYRDTNYKVIAGSKAFNFPVSTLGFTEDSGLTTYQDTSRVTTWVSGNWFVNADDVYSYTGASGDGVYTSRINATLDYGELFASRNSYVAGSGDNVVKQYNTSYSNTTDLTIGENFVIKGISYSNNQIGVATRQKRNLGNAVFITWDGVGTLPNKMVLVNDSFITSIASYKSSWVIMTSAGQLLYFNGGGFDVIANLPSFIYEDDLISLSPSGDITIGNNIDVLGDVFYIGIPSLPEFSSNQKPFRPYFAGGMYCFDPKVGLYNKHTPSYSAYSLESGTASSNIITYGSNHYLETGDEVWLADDDQGLTKGTYFAIKQSATTIKLAETYNEAFSNTSLTITDGTILTWFVKRKDYGIDMVRINDLGLVKKDRNYEGFEDTGTLPTFFGTRLRPNTLSTRQYVLNTVAAKMSNRGRIVTSRFQTNSLQDTWQYISLKYTKLSQQSSIVVKVKHKDVEPVIVGDETLYTNSYTGPLIYWDTARRFTTSFDLSDVEEGDECYVFDGAGAGCSAHIVEKTQVGSAWIVTLDEDIRGASSLLTACVCIDKFKKVGIITADDTEGVKKIPINFNSSDIEVIVELRGINVRLKELQVISAPYKEAI